MKVTLRSLLPVYLGVASILAAQQTPSIVNSTQAPVKIVSVTSRPFDMAASIALHNSSSEAAVSVRIGLVIAIPAGCGQMTYLSKDHFSDRDVWIAAGQTASLENVGISGAALRKLKREKAASSVMSQITLLEVTFSDGKHWSLERTGSTFDDDMLGAEVQSHCLRSSKQQVADGIHCTTGHLLQVQGGYNGGYYTCGNGAQQNCNNSPDASTCTNVACTSKLQCPNQACSFVSGGGGDPNDPNNPYDPSYPPGQRPPAKPVLPPPTD